jgi:hypothetical protein
MIKLGLRRGQKFRQRDPNPTYAMDFLEAVARDVEGCVWEVNSETMEPEIPCFLESASAHSAISVVKISVRRLAKSLLRKCPMAL